MACAALVADALQTAFPEVPDVPELGSFGDDLVFLVLRMREAMHSRGGLALRSVIDRYGQEADHCCMRLILEGVVEPTKQRILDVVRRDIER